MTSRNEVEELKARKRELERQIKILEEKEPLPKVYDPETVCFYPDPWGEQNRSYMIPNLKSGIGYETVKVYTACKGSPESQGYISVEKCAHPAVKRWCRITLGLKIDALKKEIAKTERMYAKYIE